MLRIKITVEKHTPHQLTALKIFLNDSETIESKVIAVPEAIPADTNPFAENALAEAVEQTRQTKSAGEEYTLADVYDLNKISSGNRKVLGRLYRQYVENATPPIARFIGRRKDRHAIYERLS